LAERAPKFGSREIQFGLYLIEIAIGIGTGIGIDFSIAVCPEPFLYAITPAAQSTKHCSNVVQFTFSLPAFYFIQTFSDYQDILDCGTLFINPCDIAD